MILMSLKCSSGIKNSSLNHAASNTFSFSVHKENNLVAYDNGHSVDERLRNTLNQSY